MVACLGYYRRLAALALHAAAIGRNDRKYLASLAISRVVGHLPVCRAKRSDNSVKTRRELKLSSPRTASDFPSNCRDDVLRAVGWHLQRNPGRSHSPTICLNDISGIYGSWPSPEPVSSPRSPLWPATKPPIVAPVAFRMELSANFIRICINTQNFLRLKNKAVLLVSSTKSLLHWKSPILTNCTMYGDSHWYLNSKY